MSINPSYESGDVNCLVTLSESVFVAGSMDGSLRFFQADQGHLTCERVADVVMCGMLYRGVDGCGASGFVAQPAFFWGGVMFDIVVLPSVGTVDWHPITVTTVGLKDSTQGLVVVFQHFDSCNASALLSQCHIELPKLWIW